MSTKIALVVGIDYYEHINPLFGCASDALSVNEILERNGDSSVNFDGKLLIGSSETQLVTRRELKDSVTNLFSAQADIALFYFAGHGYIESTGGYLLTSEAEEGDEGLALSDVLKLANDSPVPNKIIVLDSCHSGIAGNAQESTQIASLAEGLTVLTASTKDQYASEENGGGIFTGLFVDALGGSAANLTGDVTPGSVYAHIDQSLGPWEQRPVFKTNVNRFVSLRTVTPPIKPSNLRKIIEFFPSPGFEFQLDPSFEPNPAGKKPGMPEGDPVNTAKFEILQQYNRLYLLKPVDVPHMWDAAIQSKTCKLTVLGEHYRRLVEKNRI